MNGGVSLTHWGVISARGEDAAAFLHSQLTNDFSLMGCPKRDSPATARPRAGCWRASSAWKAAHDEILLACHASVLPRR
jgi:folate-binding Fe-S cluster repair protein YgfZ